VTLEQALQLLGLQLPALDGCATRDDAEAALDAWKAGPLRQAYRARAKAWHPDLGTPDEVPARTQRMKLLNAAHDGAKALTVQPRRPPRPVVVVVRYGWHGTTTASTTGDGWPW